MKRYLLATAMAFSFATSVAKAQQYIPLTTPNINSSIGIGFWNNGVKISTFNGLPVNTNLIGSNAKGQAVPVTCTVSGTTLSCSINGAVSAFSPQVSLYANVLHQIDAAEPIVTTAANNTPGIQLDTVNGGVAAIVDTAGSEIFTHGSGECVYLPNKGPNNFPFLRDKASNYGGGLGCIAEPVADADAFFAYQKDPWTWTFVMRQTVEGGNNLVNIVSTNGNTFSVNSPPTSGSDGALSFAQSNIPASNGTETSSSVTALNQWEIVTIQSWKGEIIIRRNGTTTLTTPAGILGNFGPAGTAIMQFINNSNTDVAFAEFANGAQSNSQMNAENSRLATLYGLTAPASVSDGPPYYVPPVTSNPSSGSNIPGTCGNSTTPSCGLGPTLNLTTDGATSVTQNGTSFTLLNGTGASFTGGGTNPIVLNQTVHANTTQESVLSTAMTGKPACYAIQMTNPTLDSLYNSGLVMYNKGSGATTLMFDAYANNQGSNILVVTANDFNGTNPNVLSPYGAQPYPSGSPFFQRICYDGTNYVFQASSTASVNGFNTIWTATAASLGNPDHVGFYVDADSQSSATYSGQITATWWATANYTPNAGEPGGDATQSFLSTVNLPTSDNLPAVSGAVPDDSIALPSGAANVFQTVFGTSVTGANVTTGAKLRSMFYTTFAEGNLNSALGSPSDNGQNGNSLFAGVARTYAVNDPNDVHQIKTDGLYLSNNCSQNHTHCYPDQIYGGMIRLPTRFLPGGLLEIRYRAPAGPHAWSPMWLFSNQEILHGSTSPYVAPATYAQCDNTPNGGPCYEFDINDMFGRQDGNTPMGQQLIWDIPNYGQYYSAAHLYTTAVHDTYVGNNSVFNFIQTNEPYQQTSFNCSTQFCDVFWNWRNDGSNLMDMFIAPVTNPPTPARLARTTYVEYDTINNGENGAPLAMNLILSAAQAIQGASQNGGVLPSYASITENDGIANGWSLVIQKIAYWNANVVNPNSYQ